MLNPCSEALGRLCPRSPYLRRARCFFSQLRSSSAGLVSALGLMLCRSESHQRKSPVSSLFLPPSASRPCPGYLAHSP